MTAKEFLEDKTLQAIDIVEGTIINLIVDGLPQGLSVDTSKIRYGTKLQRFTIFENIDDVITIGNITLDLATTDML